MANAFKNVSTVSDLVRSAQFEFEFSWRRDRNKTFKSRNRPLWGKKRFLDPVGIPKDQSAGAVPPTYENHTRQTDPLQHPCILFDPKNQTKRPDDWQYGIRQGAPGISWEDKQRLLNEHYCGQRQFQPVHLWVRCWPSTHWHSGRPQKNALA